MSTELIFCPACNHKLRVPAELMGQRVLCPKCSNEFNAPPPRPTAGGDERYSESPVRPYPVDDQDDRPQRDDWDDRVDRRPQRSGRGIILAPAIALIALGVLQLIGNAYTLVVLFTNPALFRQQMQQMQAMFPGVGPPPFDVVEVNKVVCVIYILICLVQMVGGICMARTRGYPMAIIGAVLAIINCNVALFCIPSFAIGIWAMIVLMLPGVRAHFTQPA